MLPSERYVASILGLTDEQYEFWRDYVRAQNKKGPQPSVVCGAETIAIVSLVLTVVGVGFQIIGFLLQGRPGRPADLKARQRNGNNQLEQTSFAPRSGFDAVQEVAGIGAPIPVVYANREVIDGVAYGGVRVNLSLLWSQLWSLGGSQMLRAVFMLSEGEIASIDPLGFAIGDNSIGVYDLLNPAANEIGSRLTIYYRSGSSAFSSNNRIVSADRIAGRAANLDIGNAQNNGGEDVFELQSVSNEWSADFCSASKPSTSTTFGVYSPIGNNLGFKLNPLVRPLYTARLKPKGDEGDAVVACDIDDVVAVQRKKYEAFFSTRSGIIGGSSGRVEYEVGDTVTYKLLRSSDFNTEFTSVSDEDDEWDVEVEVRDFDRVYEFPDFGGVIPAAELFIAEEALIDAISLGTPDINTGAQKITVRATLDVSQYEELYENVEPGKYRVSYWIRFKNDSRDIDGRLKLGVTVTIRASRKIARGGDDELDVDFTGQTSYLNVSRLIEQEEQYYKININLTVPEDSEDLGPGSGGNLRADMIFDYSKSDVYSEKADDAASSISARQRAWDDAIVIGDLYKIGSALAVCTGRSPGNEIFRSNSDLEDEGSGQGITATFRIVRGGAAKTTTEAILETRGTEEAERETATSGPHIMRVAIANITTSRECRIVELGIRSSMGVSINGLLRFRSTLSFEEADGRACLDREGDKIKRGNTVKVDQYQSGTVITSEDRYSFFRISCREYSGSSFVELDQCFGVAGLTQQAMFNYIRLEMPSLNRWEIRIEPLTGWEIRKEISDSKLSLIDSRLSGVVTKNMTTAFGTVKVTFNGREIDRDVDTFSLRQTKRDPSMGLPYADFDKNYADSWGKLAEFFIYEEIQSSASSGPEHEIVYVNEIVENDSKPSYADMAIVGINARSAFEWSQFRQLSAYVNGGAIIRRLLDDLFYGPSHLFPDVALDRFTNPKYGPGRISDELIDIDGFRNSAQWCQDNKYFFDGAVMLATESPRQWAADVASTMLLDFREINGKYSLAPALTFFSVKHKALFTAGNIEAGSFKMETTPVDDLRPIRVSAKWREERSSSSPENPGLFPVEREVLVQEAPPYGSEGDPTESVDVSGYVTNERHAIDICKFRIRSKRLRDHSIRFTTTYDGLEGVCKDLYPGDYIKVAMDSTTYSQFNNGVVLANGSIVSTADLAPGSYSVLAWDGSTSEPSTQTLTVSQDGTGMPVGIIFTTTQSSTEVKTYQVSRISPTEDGKFSLECIHAPINDKGELLIAEDWNNEDSWVISR